jgi:hypothetical protein
MTRMLVVLCALTVAGCGVAAKIDPRAEYQNSLDDYRACINSDLKNLQACEGKRAVMETNERAYNNTTTGMTQGGNAKDAGISPRNSTANKGIVQLHPEPLAASTSSSPLDAPKSSSPPDAVTSSSPPDASASSSPPDASKSSPMPF